MSHSSVLNQDSATEEEQEESGLLLRFANGATHRVSGLVAADGIYSTVRQLKSLHRQQQSFAPHGMDGFKQEQEQKQEQVASLSTTTSVLSATNNKDHGDDDASRSLARRDLTYLNLFVILGIAKNDTFDDECGEAARDSVSVSVSMDGNGTKRRKVQWVDGSTRVFTMPYDRHHLMWQLSFPFSAQDLQEYFSAKQRNHTTKNTMKDKVGTTSDGVEEEGEEDEGRAHQRVLKEMALRRCQGWHSTLVHMLERSEEALISGHPVYDRDPGSTAAVRGGGAEGAVDEGAVSEGGEGRVDVLPRCSAAGEGMRVFHEHSKVTMLGDALHPMSPFKGQVWKFVRNFVFNHCDDICHMVSDYLYFLHACM